MAAMAACGVKRKHDEVENDEGKKVDEIVVPSADDVSNEVVEDEFGSRSNTNTKHCVEVDVGITEHVNVVSSFTGIIKQRYSDFVVNEIDNCGNVVVLDNLDLPEPRKEIKHSIDYLDEEILQKLATINDSKDCKDTVEIKENCNSKEHRQKIHEIIRQNFPNLCSSTEDEKGEKVIKIQQVKSLTKDQTRRFRSASVWPSQQPNYLQFVLYKENKDTMEAINLIAKVIRKKPTSFSYAGVKDKRAKTSQLVTIYRLPAERLKNLKINGISIGNFKYVDAPIKLGDLTGNRFKIVIRNLIGNGNIENAVKKLNENGFVNYYGMQRFGTTEIPTHHVGKALLLGKWEEAIELILKPRAGEPENVTKHRKIWWETRDPAAAFEKLGNKNSTEGKLLQGLQKHGPKDFLNALNFIPRNTRLMYIHSFQSYIWNLMVSKRIRKHGLAVLDGDLYLKNDSSDVPKSKIEPSVFRRKNDVETITVYDVVMPLPGFSSQYPENEVGEWYTEILNAEGITLENFANNTRAYSLQGGYRKIVVKPIDMTWSLVKYSDVMQPLVQSDLDQINGTTLKIDEEQNHSHVAVCLQLSLPSSTYATMALREILNVDTSAKVQSTLS